MRRRQCEEGQHASVVGASTWHWPQLSWRLLFVRANCICSISVLLLGHQPKVPVLFCFGKRAKYSLEFFLVKDDLSLCFCLTLCSMKHTSVLWFSLYTHGLTTCDVEIITGQASVPLLPSTDTSKTWALFATAPGTTPANTRPSVSIHVWP